MFGHTNYILNLWRNNSSAYLFFMKIIICCSIFNGSSADLFSVDHNVNNAGIPLHKNHTTNITITTERQKTKPSTISAKPIA